MKSLISFSEKSYMMRRSSRISLIGFSEKSCGNPKGRGEMKEIPYRLYRKILYE